MSFYDLQLIESGIISLTVADDEGIMLVTPSSAQGVHIAAADTTREDLDVNVIVTLRLEFVNSLVKIRPCLGRVDLESYGLVLGEGDSLGLLLAFHSRACESEVARGRSGDG